jgi:hypothetical protein
MRQPRVAVPISCHPGGFACCSSSNCARTGHHLALEGETQWKCNICGKLQSWQRLAAGPRGIMRKMTVKE